MQSITDASGKTYHYNGGEKEALTDDPLVGYEFFFGTNAVFYDSETYETGVLKTSRGELIKKTVPFNIDTASSALQKIGLVLERQHKLRLVTPIYINLSFQGNATTYGINGVLQQFISTYISSCSNFVPHDQCFRTWNSKNPNDPVTLGSFQALVRDLNTKALEMYTHLQTIGIANNASYQTSEFLTFIGFAEELASAAKLESPTRNTVEDLIMAYNEYINLSETIKQILTEVKSYFAEQNSFSWGQKWWYEAAYVAKAVYVLTESVNYGLLSEELSPFFSGINIPATESSISVDEVLEFQSFNARTTNILLEESGMHPEQFYSVVLRRASEILDESLTDEDTRVKNLQSLINCIDPAAGGFDNSSYSKLVTIQDISDFIAIMHDSTKNRSRLSSQERLHVETVSARMDQISFDDYNRIFLKYADPETTLASDKRAMLSAATIEDLAIATAHAAINGLLRALRMHMVYFSAAWVPQDTARLADMLRDSSSSQYALFKQMLQKMLSSHLKVEPGASYKDFFEEKVFGFATQDTWFVSLVSLIYSLNPYSMQNPIGTRPTHGNLEVLQASGEYVMHSEPMLSILHEWALDQYVAESGLVDIESKTLASERIWHDITNRSVKVNTPDGSLTVENGTIVNMSCVEMSWEPEGLFVSIRDQDRAIHTMPLFQEDGNITAELENHFHAMFTHSDAFIDGTFAYSKTFSSTGSRMLAKGFTIETAFSGRKELKDLEMDLSSITALHPDSAESSYPQADPLSTELPEINMSMAETMEYLDESEKDAIK